MKIPFLILCIDVSSRQFIQILQHLSNTIYKKINWRDL